MIIADFSEGLSELTTEKLYQWDIGQQLQISGISAANGDMQVHFANPAMKQAIVKDGEYSGGVLTVDIPNEFLQVGGSVPGRAWLYCYDADSKAKTVKTIYIPIVARNRPNDYVSPEDPDSKGIVDRAMELLENYETDLAGKLSSAAGAVKTANIDTGAVTEAKLATDSVATAKIKDSNVTEAKLAANSVTTAKIKDGNVTEAKLAAAFKGTLYKVDTTARSNITSADIDSKKIYTNFTINYNGTNRKAIVMNFDSTQTFIALCADGMIFTRTVGTGWQCIYNPNDKTTSITNSNKSSNILFPTIKAVVDYIAALFATVINNDNKSSNALLPTIKAVVDYLTANYTDTTALNTLLNTRLSSKADTSYVDSGLNTKADSSALTAKENLSNKISTGENLHIYKNSTDKYPAAKAIVDYLMQYYANKNDQEYLQGEIADICAYLGYTSSDILGLQVDFVNSRFTRLAGAEELEAGSDFDAFPMFGGRRRCCVANDGTINAYYGEQGYAEDGTNGQVMVYQPKFYYRMVPLKLEKQASGIGYHIRKANYYVTANPHPGFKLHPLFYDANGNEIDYVLLSAYEGSMYDVSASAYVNDSVDTSVSYGEGDLLCSVAGKKPISGRLAGVGNKEQFETMANNIGSGWHLNTIKAESANQLLMLIELGRFNTQAAIGQGVVSCPSNGSYNCSSYTGSTASLGNATGMATETTYESAGTETVNTTNGKLSVSYRGVENPWGNIWKHTNGVNLWGDGHMGGGQVFICDDFSFNESKHDGNYQSAGFTIPDGDGYVSAFGYGDEEFDWLFMPSEATGNSSLPVGDNYWCEPNLNGHRVALLGGRWTGGVGAGVFCWACYCAPGGWYFDVGGRLLYVPTA